MRITGEELKDNLEKNPDWCIGKELTVTTFADLSDSPVRALSPDMEFIGRNEHGDVIRLWGCKNLPVLEGSFDGGIEAGADGMVELDKPDKDGNLFKKISASPNGIIEVKNCRVNYPNKKGYAADFGGSEALAELTGKFHGAVLVGGEYQNNIPLSTNGLEITGCNEEGTSLISIWTKFKKLEGKFSGGISAYFSEFDECGSPVELEITSADKNGFKLTAYPSSPFKELPKPEDYPFKPREVTITGSDETGDQDQENDQDALEDLAVLRVQIEAFKKREAQRVKKRPWTEQAKREMVKSIAERLKLDDMLKEEHISPDNPKRFGLLKLCPIVITVAVLTAGTFGKDIFEKIREKTIIDPIATSLIAKGKDAIRKENYRYKEAPSSKPHGVQEISIPTRYFGPIVKYLQTNKTPEDLKKLQEETLLVDQLEPKELKERLEAEKKAAQIAGLDPHKITTITQEYIVEKIKKEFNASENPWEHQLKGELSMLEGVYQKSTKENNEVKEHIISTAKAKDRETIYPSNPINPTDPTDSTDPTDPIDPAKNKDGSLTKPKSDKKGGTGKKEKEELISMI